MAKRVLFIVFVILSIIQVGCSDLKMGGWIPFEWQIESVNSIEDISVTFTKEGLFNNVIINCFADSGEIKLKVLNHTPCLHEEENDYPGNETINRNTIKFRKYKWGEIKISGHDIKITITDLSQNAINEPICIYLLDLSAQSYIKIIRNQDPSHKKFILKMGF